MIDIQFDPVSKEFTHISASLIIGLCTYANDVSGLQAAEDLGGEFCAFLGKNLDRILKEAQQ